MEVLEKAEEYLLEWLASSMPAIAEILTIKKEEE